jgi:hypothetical protein
MKSTAQARRELLRQDFTEKLPANLGEPYIMSTFASPFVFVAFYPVQNHGMTDGSVVIGSEFRLLEYGKGFNESKTLGGVLGLRDDRIVLVALNCCATRAKDFEPYKKMIKEMFAEAVAHAHD